MSLHPSSSYLVKRLVRNHLKPYRKHLAGAVTCMILAGGATAANAWLMQPALDKIFIQKDETMLLLIPAAVLIVAITSALANFGQNLLMRYIGQRVIADLQVDLFSHLMRSDLRMFHDQSSGKLISRFTNDIQLMRAACSNALTTMAKECISLVFLIGVMLIQNPYLTLLAFGAFPIAIYPVIRLGKRMRKVSDRTQHKLGEFTGRLDEIFSGVKSVKAYARENFEIQRARNSIEDLFRMYFKAARTQSGSSPLMEALSGVTIGVVIYVGGTQVLHGDVTPGAFFSFIAALIMAYRPIKAIAGLNTNIQEGLAAAARLFTVMDTKPQITDVPNAPSLHVQQGNIRFENVSFIYGENTAGVFDISLEVPAGKTVALVGLSGSGKTTLINLLLRFYDVQQGRIMIDGQDIRDVTQSSLRESMALVPQDAVLFDDTACANIAYGRLDATREEIIAAAQSAAADDFLQALPEGYDTMIGPHGVKLSGGQRQRLSIARAMLKNAPILLLDEATSSLDNESERAVQDALKRLMQGRTTLVIAHRLSTIIDADIIHVIDQGRVVESGSHAALLAAKSRYYQLYATHFTN